MVRAAALAAFVGLAGRAGVIEVQRGGRTGAVTTCRGLGTESGAVDAPSAVSAALHRIDIVERVGLARSSYFAGGAVTLGEIGEGDGRPTLLTDYMHAVQRRNIPWRLPQPPSCNTSTTGRRRAAPMRRTPPR